MSWSASLDPVKKTEAAAAIDSLQVPRSGPDNQPMDDQIAVAKAAAKALLATVPGPMVAVSINGHANGLGWQKKQGWANDSISVSVWQVTEEDLSYRKCK